MEPALHIIVEGLVQGVGFRYYAQGVANKMGVAGWVRNLPGGQVEILARVTVSNKEPFLAALRHGPPASRVDGLRIGAAPGKMDCPARGFSVKM